MLIQSFAHQSCQHFLVSKGLPYGEPQCSANASFNNEFLILSCSWEAGVPRALVWWAFSSGDVQGLPEENSNVLVLRSSAGYNGKTFVCHSKHPLIKESKKCVVTLGMGQLNETLFNIITFRIKVLYEKILHLSPTEKPVLMPQQSVVSVFEGNDIQINCMLSKTYPPVTKFMWYNNLKQAVGDKPKKYIVQQADTWSNLTVQETDSQVDSGQYWCSATNALGGTEISILLLVMSKLAKIATFISCMLKKKKCGILLFIWNDHWYISMPY